MYIILVLHEVCTLQINNEIERVDFISRLHGELLLDHVFIISTFYLLYRPSIYYIALLFIISAFYLLYRPSIYNYAVSIGPAAGRNFFYYWSGTYVYAREMFLV